METAIVVAWIVILLGALGLTVIAVAEVVRVVHHAREINRLARITLPAAQGIAANTALIGALPGVAETVGRLLETTRAIGRVAAGLEEKTGALARGLGRPGGA